MKQILTGEKELIEIRPSFEDNIIKISIFKNGNELDWGSLSDKEKVKYSKLLDKRYYNDTLPLSSYTPKVAPRNSMVEYSHPLIDRDTLLLVLRDWEKCPESHPVIEEWFQSGCPTVETPKTQDEIDFGVYSPMFMEARELKSIDPIKALENYTYILINFKPIGTIYYTEPAELFCKLCRYDEAIFCLARAKENIEEFNKETQAVVIYEFAELIAEIGFQKELFNKLISIISDSPSIVQSEIYKKYDIDGNKARFVIHNMDYAGFIRREKYRNSYKLFCNEIKEDTDRLIGF